MDLRRLQTFVTVAELGTVTEAALRLHVAQPALSRQIGDLEDELGVDESRFGNQPLEAVELLAACHRPLALGVRGAIEITRLAPYPLLLLDSGFGFRRAFDAACRLAGLKPTIRLESRSPHTLLALAEAGHGVAIIPSALRTQRYKLRIVAVTYRGRPLREPLTILWDKRRPLPPYAVAFCEMLAAHVRKVFPITRAT